MAQSDVKDSPPADPRGKASRAFAQAQVELLPGYLAAAQANLGPDFSVAITKGMMKTIQAKADASIDLPVTQVEQRWNALKDIKERDARLDPVDQGPDKQPWHEQRRGRLAPAYLQRLNERFMASLTSARGFDQAHVNTIDISSSNVLVYFPGDLPADAVSRSLLTDLVLYEAPAQKSTAVVVWQPPKPDEKRAAKKLSLPKAPVAAPPEPLERDRLISAERGGKIPAAVKSDVMISLPKAVECYIAELTALDYRESVAGMWLRNINAAMGYAGVAPLRHRADIKTNPEIAQRHKRALIATFVLDPAANNLDNAGVAMQSNP